MDINRRRGEIKASAIQQIDQAAALINKGMWWFSIGIWNATMVFLWMNLLVPALLVGWLFFVWLESLRQTYFPSKYFAGGPANWVTWIRLLCISCLVFWADSQHMWLFVLLCSLEVGLDVLDGWLARKYQSQNIVGEYFDKEMDAFYVMIVVLLIYYKGLAGPWILGLGLIRFFMPFIKSYLQEPTRKDPRTNYGKFIAGIVMGGLAIAWIFPPLFQSITYGVLGGLLAYSFGKEIWEGRGNVE